MVVSKASKIMLPDSRVDERSNGMLTARISIIVPFFNAPALQQALASAVMQTGVNAEIVAIDDGSTDDSPSIARSFEPAIRVLSGPNQGASFARNRGIGQTEGEWIVFLDADDVLAPGTLRL